MIYVANCIEAGERFKVIFKTAKKNVEDIGAELASTYGGECTSVKKWKPETTYTVTNKKSGNSVETTERAFKNWVKKLRADGYKVEDLFEIKTDTTTAPSGEVYDYDKEGT